MAVPVPVPAGGSGGELNSVSCTAADSCEAVGTYSKEKVLPAGDTSAPLNGISCTAGPVCEAVGYHERTVIGSHLLALRYSS